MIKKYLTAYKELCLLRKQFAELKIQLSNIEFERRMLESNSIFNVISQILNKNLEWFDFGDLKPNDKQIYYNEAQQILRTHVFKNEINFLKSNWGKRALLEANDMNKDKIARHVEKMSWMLLGIELLKQRFEGIPNPTPQSKSTEDISSSI